MIMFVLFHRYTGLDSNPADFQMTPESAKHLKLLEEKIRERNLEIEKLIVINEIDDESGSGSGSGGGNIIL